MTEAQKIQEISVAGALPTRVGDNDYAVVPNNYDLEDLEKFYPTPRRIKEKIGLASVDSFIEYTNKFKNESTTIIAASEPPVYNVVALVDYHTPESPSWKSHQVVLACQLSNEWKVWEGGNKKSYSQLDFANFIEDNMIDIVDPCGADLLEVVRNLEIKRNVNFKSAINLNNGNYQLSYQEEDSTTGVIQVPSEITIAVAPFKYGELIGVKVKIRYTMKDGRLNFVYNIIRPHLVVDHAFAQIVDKIKESTGIYPLFA